MYVALFVKPVRLIDPFVALHPEGFTKLVEAITGARLTTTFVDAGCDMQLLAVAVTV